MTKKRSRRATLRRIALRCLAVLAAVLGIAASAVALAVYRPQMLVPLVERALTPRGGSASLAGMTVTLRPLALSLEGLSITPPPGEGDLLRLDRVRVEAALGRLLRGGPWLRRVEAAGLLFERSQPRPAAGPPDLTPLTRLFDIEELSLTDARLRLALPHGDLAAHGLGLVLAPGEGGVRRFLGSTELTFARNGSTLAEGTLTARGEVSAGPAIEADIELTPARLDLPWLAGEVLGQAGLRVTRKGVQADNVTLTLPGAHLRLGTDAPRSMEPIRLVAAGSATLDGREPRLEVRALDVGDLLRARARLGGATLEDLSGAAEGEIPRVERAGALMALLLPGRLEGLELEGELPFRLTLDAREAQRVLDVEIRPRDLGVSWAEAGLACRVGGALKASSPVQGWRDGAAAIEGRLQGTGRLDRPPLALRRFRFDVPVSGDLAAVALRGWRLAAGAGEVLFEGRPLPLGTLGVRGSAKASAGSVRVEGLEVDSATLGRLKGDLAFGAKGIGGSLDGHGLRAAALLSLAGAVADRDWTGLSPVGTVDVAARMVPGESGPRVTAAVAFDGIGFTAATGDVMARNLGGRLDLEARPDPDLRLTAGLAMDRGEALWGTVYLDLAQDPFEVHGGLLRREPENYEDVRVDARWAGFGRLEIQGRLREEAGRWRHEGRLALREARLGPAFRTFLGDPMAGSHPGLAGLEMDGGARLDLSFSGSEKRADVEGRFRLDSAAVRREGGPPVLSGLEIDLPLAYSLGVADPGRPMPSKEAGWGRLRLSGLRLAGQDLGPLELPVILVPNRLYLGGGLDASLLGAAVQLRRIRVEQPLSSDFRIDLAAQVDGLEFARLAGEGSALEGSVGGLLDPVRIGRERVTAAGVLTGDFFGGRIDIRRLTMDRPFGPGRELGADVSAHLVDLERLSAALNVGRVTGRISGSAEGLRVAYGQPVAFRLRVESVPVRGETQRVSLKAVNAISMVSTGSRLSGAGVSLITTFFREFPYAKIGLKCDLNNDVFTVQGLIHEDGVEYLVKRPLFAGIDVINRNPDNRIRFSDMLERLKRVTGDGSE